MSTATAKSGAAFSVCRRWRYSLWRRWAPGDPIVFIGLNPSTADETIDDPTIRRCIGFCKRENAGAYVMLNLYAWRSTDPAALAAVDDPVGIDNPETLARWASKPYRIVAAWGAHPMARARDAATINLLLRNRPAGLGVECLGKTQSGFPRHPLYLPKTAALETYSGSLV